MKYFIIVITFLILIVFSISKNHTQSQLLEELYQQKHIKLSKELLNKFSFMSTDSISENIENNAPFSTQAIQWYYSKDLNAYIYEIKENKFTKFYTYYSENSWWWQDNTSKVKKVISQLQKEISLIKLGSG